MLAYKKRVGDSRSTPIIICQLFPLVDVSFCKYNDMFIAINTNHSGVAIWLQEKIEEIFFYWLWHKNSTHMYVKIN